MGLKVGQQESGRGDDSLGERSAMAYMRQSGFDDLSLKTCLNK